MMLKSPTKHRIHFGLPNGSGHVMGVEPDGTDVPPRFVQAAFAAGAVNMEFMPDEEQKPQAPMKTHEELIVDGIKKMLERDEEGDFTAAGLPDRRKLAGLVGLNVTAETLVAAWKKVNESD